MSVLIDKEKKERRLGRRGKGWKILHKNKMHKERELKEKLALIDKRIKELREKKPAVRKQKLGQKDGSAWEAVTCVHVSG